MSVLESAFSHSRWTIWISVVNDGWQDNVTECWDCSKVWVEKLIEDRNNNDKYETIWEKKLRGYSSVAFFGLTGCTPLLIHIMAMSICSIPNIARLQIFIGFDVWIITWTNLTWFHGLICIAIKNFGLRKNLFICVSITHLIQSSSHHELYGYSFILPAVFFCHSISDGLICLFVY